MTNHSTAPQNAENPSPASYNPERDYRAPRPSTPEYSDSFDYLKLVERVRKLTGRE